MLLPAPLAAIFKVTVGREVVEDTVGEDLQGTYRGLVLICFAVATRQ